MVISLQAALMYGDMSVGFAGDLEMLRRRRKLMELRRRTGSSIRHSYRLGLRVINRLYEAQLHFADVLLFHSSSAQESFITYGETSAYMRRPIITLSPVHSDECFH